MDGEIHCGGMVFLCVPLLLPGNYSITLSLPASSSYSLVLPVRVRVGSVAGRVLRIVWDYVFMFGHTSSVQTVLQKASENNRE